jgi:hypothetical protein
MGTSFADTAFLDEVSAKKVLAQLFLQHHNDFSHAVGVLNC